MDWTTPLRSQQMDFIERLKSGHLLHCNLNGRYSELRIIPHPFPSQDEPSMDSFLDRQLGKEALKAGLDDFIAELDSDRDSDFSLTSNPRAKIRAIACRDAQKVIQWSATAEELQNNAVLVYFLIQPIPGENPAKYRLILAGFLPTNTIGLPQGSVIFTLDNFLYAGGLHSYLESLNCGKKEKIEIYNASSLRYWLPELDDAELERGDREEWKQRFISWLQNLVLKSERENLRLHLYDLLNTDYYRKTLWQLYLHRERQILVAAGNEEFQLIIQQSDLDAENMMFELTGLSKNS